MTEASHITFIEEQMTKQYSCELTFGWLSAEAKTESYNQANRDSYHENQTKRFLEFNPCIGKLFNDKREKEDEVDDEEEETGETELKVIKENKMFQMSRKSLGQALLNYEIKEELKEKETLNEVRLGPLKSCGRHKGFKETRKELFKSTDEERKRNLYKHTCYEGCKKRGCQRISTFDGLWKIHHAICMWDNRTEYPASVTEFVPQVCPSEPEYGSAFCNIHARAVEQLKRPSKLRPFLKSCGTDGQKVNKEDKSKIDSVLKEMALKTNIKAQSVGVEQGTEEMLRNERLMNSKKLTLEEVEDCRKDVGENVRLRRYTRGILAACSGGGHIWSFDALYKSEGPLQVSLLMIKYLMKRLAVIDPKLWSKHFINYDNICNVDRLKLLKGLLDLPEPFSSIWQDVGKVIDPLHIKNHKNPDCHEKYNPSKVKSEIPDANLMVCEQTFSWLGKFKKILNSMPKYTQLFLLHRLVQRRNEYTQYCYSIGTRPMLPSVKSAKL